MAGHVIPDVESSFGTVEEDLYEQLTNYIDNIIAREQHSSSPSAVPVDPMDFEAFCRKALEQCGWHVTGTPASGDQGVDLVATLGDPAATESGTATVHWPLVVAIQCKRYSSAVGNHAVQEVYAGAKHYRAHLAAVVSNAPYTRAARELATSCGVRLLNPVDLPKLRKIVLAQLERGGT